ncbi:LRR receptor-like serine/threonine-protein kinase GSO1 [Durio zibethinus]|uniref:LRR receptor-like serine/threonine-protein kinase GSO1 n=1 Tax=Durio zibethinus TaxID=66656 RepID=A0A6P6AGC4_DURZI|nr:LRR receptor-like serine/threonine-protein kinase GSO1 [Durio zibethinus]
MEITAFYTYFLLLLICFNCQGCLEEERDALLKIKASFNSPDPGAFSNWYVQECCQWEGVECDPSTNRISKIFFHYWRDRSLPDLWYPNATLFAQFKDLQELELPGNQIGGFISPHAFIKLKRLRKLNLHDNSIHNGSNLWWGKFPSIYSVDLSYNKFTTDGLCSRKFPFLYSLDLSGNKLDGNIPECLCDNRFFKELILSDNNLHGSIGSCLGNMVSLKHLDLSSNQFNDSFPSMLISNLTSIDSLILSRNEFKGMISLSIFANLSRLRCLDISYNHLEVETESPSWSPSFNLNVLHLSGCDLKNIPSFLSTQHHLLSLDLSYNLLIGNISWMLCNVTSELRLRGNNLSGSFPRTFQNISSQLTVLDISDNFLHGPLPKDIDLNFPRLRFLNVSMNSFNSNLPQSLGSQILRELDLSNNQFQGEIPYSMTRNMTSLEYLRLSGNNLRGDALPKNSSLPKIRWLYLNKNYFSGTFPDTLGKSMDLEIVDIRRNSLSGELSLYLPVLPQLRALLLGGNRFDGQIPLQVCQMRDLQLLDISRNSLSGEIPDCVGNITSWTDSSYRVYLLNDHRSSFDIIINGFSVTLQALNFDFMGIDVSFNRLTGKIPVQMTRLKMIHFLNMSNNLLTGQIRSPFGNLANLESLDLSHNNLFGGLPLELTTLEFLALFNVSFNNLSGMIPVVAQFGTFTSDSYLGNPGLCGLPVGRQCAETAPVYLSAETSVFLFTDTATGYTLLFWCVIFFLY